MVSIQISHHYITFGMEMRNRYLIFSTRNFFMMGSKLNFLNSMKKPLKLIECQHICLISLMKEYFLIGIKFFTNLRVWLFFSKKSLKVSLSCILSSNCFNRPFIVFTLDLMMYKYQGGKQVQLVRNSTLSYSIQIKSLNCFFTTLNFLHKSKFCYD